MEEKLISVKDYGAVGNGIKDDLLALQAAFDSGEQKIYVPAGKYLVNGTLVLRSHTHLILHPNAEIVFGRGCGKSSKSYLLTNEYNAVDITVDGGKWNGNADFNPRVIKADGKSYLGVCINFEDVKDLTLRNMTVRDSEGFHIRLMFVKGFLVENITFDDLTVRITQDGINVSGGCEDGIIRHIRAVGASSPNDDMIAFISDIDKSALAPNDPCKDHRAGDIKNIHVYDVHAQNTFCFARLYSERGMIENITLENFSGGCYYLGLQMQVGGSARRALKEGKPFDRIKNIRISNWNIHFNHYHNKVRDMLESSWGDPNSSPNDYATPYMDAMAVIEHRFSGLVIEDFKRNTAMDVMPFLPMININNGGNNKLAFSAESGAVINCGGKAVSLGVNNALEGVFEDTVEIFTDGIARLTVDTDE